MGKAKKKEKGTNEKPGKKLNNKDYLKKLAKLHVELVKLQEWVKAKGLKVCIVFEGRDVRVKGGVNQGHTERVAPGCFAWWRCLLRRSVRRRRCMVSAYTGPFSGGRRGGHLRPQLVHRAGVERVMGFCTEEQAKRFLQVIPTFGMMVESGSYSSSTGSRSIRTSRPAGWKGASMMGARYGSSSAHGPQILRRWDDYTRARDEMFAATDTAWAPW